MKPTTVAFIQWLKHQAETYLRIVDRDIVAMILWQQRRGFHWAWKSIEEQRVMREKLIRQVSYRIASIFNERLSRWPTVGERDEIRDKVAGEIVGLVLSAIHDGLEIPGEDGRWIYGASPELQHWLIGMLAAGSTTFIALRPLPGMKEKT